MYRTKVLLFIWMITVTPKYAIYAQANFMDQHQVKLDSVINDLKKFPKDDTARIGALWKIINFTLFKKEKEAVMPYSDELLRLSRKLNHKKGILNSMLFKGSYFKSALNYQQAINYYDSIIQVVDKSSDTTLFPMKAAAQNHKGQIYYTQGNYTAALTSFFAALEFYINRDPMFTAYIYNSIAIIYRTLHLEDKAIQYAKLFLTTAEKYKVEGQYSKGILLLTDMFLDQQLIDSAKLYLKNLQPVMPNIDFPTETFSYYTKLGIIANKEKQFKVATGYFETALLYAIKSGHGNMKSEVYYYFSKNEMDRGNLNAAKAMTDSLVKYAQIENNKEFKKGSYELLSRYYAKTGNYTIAYSFQEKFNLLKDSLASESGMKQANILAAFYENSLKENQILALKLQNKEQEKVLNNKANLNKLLTVVLLGLSIVGFLGYRSYTTKQKLQQLTISTLEKNKQLLTIDAMLKGQEEERSRIAKDLHDGLGGMLSGIKLNFTNMKENLIMDSANVTAFENSIIQLDQTISELRKVAHNLMPEALVKFGLKNAILDYANTMQLASKVSIYFEQMGEERELGNTNDLYIYRIIQELINNAVKHAAANRVLVQLTKTNNRVILTVEDDGKGFDLSAVEKAKGIGLKNLQQRVDYLKGIMAIESKTMEGTAIHIELQA